METYHPRLNGGVIWNVSKTVSPGFRYPVFAESASRGSCSVHRRRGRRGKREKTFVESPFDSRRSGHFGQAAWPRAPDLGHREHQCLYWEHVQPGLLTSLRPASGCGAGLYCTRCTPPGHHVETCYLLTSGSRTSYPAKPEQSPGVILDMSWTGSSRLRLQELAEPEHIPTASTPGRQHGYIRGGGKQGKKMKKKKKKKK
ncbi:unnamed protein product [Pleuronectes platessa]|uniref:Uncharacterized protein n=1 Tax=Pleuronectes platessa TaxID=8262 RepID=A0A9N7TQC5_PLEPL|nr:unnamed protein product [Pleuronectes platessa]